ncbi:Mur ligase [Colletotrichum acutatum]|uniref:tetrahydrofolate synthase n=1 Tax=Glomerella acutata TaxID=27357 RepID=A0AAD9D3M7_GLOAC|nr:Mur ligase [Colletotrichum acutatum]KAK1731666.1 Mur ligase [Colletotrichum acutatum]
MSSPSPAPSRSYTDAINLLNTLIPNLKVHALFNKPKDAAPTTAAPATDPNLLAIPEMRAWLLRANLTPERLSSLSFIHIAGTKGKGSVTALTTSALLNRSSSSPPTTQIGPIGTYTSPHLLSPRERIAISNTPISQTLFTTSFFELWDTLSSCASSAPGGSASDGPDLGIEPGSKPFYFRFLTLLALHIFLKLRVRTVVLECGIGGEYDATNAIPAEAVTTSVITQLGIDHVAMLGSTASQIAWHKAGVMKPGVATFTRKLSDEVHQGVMSTLRSRAQEIGAELIEVEDEDVVAWSGVPGAKLPGGDLQKRNQALAALAARRHVQVLQAREAGSKTVGEVDASLADVPEVIIAGLREATLRGRHEVLRQGSVSWYLDGAHNADSLAEVARWISPIITTTTSLDTANNNESFILVFNQQERDAPALLINLLRQMKALGVDLETRLAAAVFTRNDKTNIAGEGGDVDLIVQEACAAACREMCPATKAVVCKDLTEMKSSVDGVARLSSSGTKVLVTGSMYLVGNVIGLLEPEGVL